MQNSPLILKPSKIKSIILILISIGFISLGIKLLEKNMLIAVLNIFFFGICLIIFIINMIPNSPYLKIDEKGIEMKNLFRITFIPWQAVSGFKTKFIFVNKLVIFNIDEKLLENSKMKGKTGAFPDTYGMSAKDLANLLNEYKAKFEAI
ncbi:PH domain-containing protein [Chryseobacterium sp. LC2016-27]|uniref:PH domain-containing protein n=1 Tax=Chryseobacterium sp. LC2016-27 TaxID=2897326 RepID=UPI001E3C4DBC|nr:PH domain-containing protein [Chryseobacterium sp. LC2016-27]MCD0453868.1 PH domain-containing protein [Chryseobacterium sp. LC2016-27]